MAWRVCQSNTALHNYIDQTRSIFTSNNLETCKKLLLKRLKSTIEGNLLITDYQFGFRNKRNTIDQIHRIISRIEKAPEEKLVCCTVFSDVVRYGLVLRSYK